MNFTGNPLLFYVNLRCYCSIFLYNHKNPDAPEERKVCSKGLSVFRLGKEDKPLRTFKPHKVGQASCLSQEHPLWEET
jgi:hypothetical protein